MPLKVRVKPEGKFFVNGATIKNAGNRPIDLLILEGEFRRMDFKRPDHFDLSRWEGEGGAA
jgi:hypothetical protein